MTVVQLKWVKKVCGIFCVEFQFVLIGIPSKMEETTKNVRRNLLDLQSKDL